MTIIAIDPGVNGGIAWQHDGGHPCAQSMPETEVDIAEALRELTEHGGAVAYIEDVPIGMPGKGAAMAKLNANAGFIRGVLAASGVRTILVRPAKWQSHYSLGKRSGCQSDNEWKNKLKSEAQRRFPHLRVTLKHADALLILDYAKETK